MGRFNPLIEEGAGVLFVVKEVLESIESENPKLISTILDVLFDERNKLRCDFVVLASELKYKLKEHLLK